MVHIPDIRQIRIFLTLEKTRSFTAAAEKLNITQSAVSHSVKALETSLNCRLIERYGKKCGLSPHGEVFIHHARLAYEQLELASKKINTLNKWGYSSIKVGASATLCQYIIPEALASFYSAQNRTEVFITPGDTKSIVQKLNVGDIDIAFGLRKKSLENDYNFIPIVEDSLCFISSPDHPWCDTKPESCEDFENERFIIYGNDSVTAQIINSHLPGIGIRQRATLAIGNMESIKKMAALGVGVGIISDWIAREELSSRIIVSHPITPAPKRQWGYYIGKTKYLSLAEEEFIRVMITQFKKCLELAEIDDLAS